MNGLPLPRFALRGSLNPSWSLTSSYHGYRRFRQKLQLNTFLRFLAPRQLQILTKDVLEPSSNMLILTLCPSTKSNSAPKTLLNKSISPCKAQCCWRQSISPSANIRLTKLIANNVSIDPVALEEDFCLRGEVCIAFPLELSNTTTREAISHFQVQITNVVKYIDHIYYYCNRFVDPIELNLVSDNEPILMAVFETNILYWCNLDICSCSEIFNFYHDCWNQISGSNKLKFSIFNKIP